MTQALVVGAGLSGLAAAWHLRDAGFEVRVTDRLARPGGLLQSVSSPHGLVERAAPAFVWTATTARWFDRLGLTPEFAAPVSRRRYIFRDGRPRRWPLGPGETLGAAAKLLRARLTGGLRPSNGESASDWGLRVAGRAATDWVIAPALQGTYAASARDLTAELVFQTPPRRRMSAAPAGGMSLFVERLAEALERSGVTFTLNTTIDRLDPACPTIIATDASAAVRLLEPHAPAAAQALREVRMHDLHAVTAMYAPHAEDIHGFGVLFPRRCGVDALGVLFVGDVFTTRTTARAEMWIYGDQGEGDDVEPRLRRDRRALTGRDDSPLWIDAARDISRRVPVYGPAILEVRKQLATLPPWISLAGNYLGRLGVTKLLEVSEEAARRIASRPGG
jgi:oxygen-dependent protoporphyrinogen oxidase